MIRILSGLRDDLGWSLSRTWGGIFTGETQNDPCMELFITIDEYNSYNTNYIDNVVMNPKTIEKENEINECIDD